MPDSSITPANPPALPLRLKEPQFTEGEWPCAADRLGRDKEIENLTPVLLNAQAPLVFAIDAPWGGGKTTFIRLWQHYLKKEGKVSLYLNAWESDFAEDPLLPMLAVLDDWFSTFDPESPTGKIWKKTKELGPSLLRTGLTAGVKLATLGALDADAAIERAAAEAAGGVAGDIVDTFKSKQSALVQFKVLLNKMLDELPADQQNLIVFVDELDRCKPTYAIEVLERIKHLFDIDRLVFVLAINRDQLSKSLQGVYGPSFDGLHYLKRFIDLDYRLQTSNIETYIDARIAETEITPYFGSRRDGQDYLQDIKAVFNWLTLRFGYELRDVDQLITRLRLVLRSIPASQLFDPAVLACMLVLRSKNVELYTSLANDGRCVNEVIEYFLGGKSDQTDFPEFFGWIAGGLILSAFDRYNQKGMLELLAPWEALTEELAGSQDPRLDELDRLTRRVKEHRMVRLDRSVREIAFERIELINQIDVSS